MTTRARRNSVIVAASLLAIAAGATVAMRGGRAPEPPPLGPGTRLVAPGIYILNGLGPSAAYAIETAKGLVLVDSGLEADAKPLKARMADEGLDWRDVRAICLTHAHGDHCGGAQAIRDATHAKIYAGAGDAEVIRRGGPREAVFSTFYMPRHDPHHTAVDQPLSGGETIDFGDASITALALPGHTPGSVAYLLERGGLRALFTGDIVMQLGGKAVGTYSAYLAPRYRGDATAYLATLKRMRAMPVPDLILPGHPLSDASPQSPRLTQGRWDEMCDAGIREMETLLAHYEKDGADFLDGTPKAILPGVLYLGDFAGRAVYGLRSGGKFALVHAPGGAGLASFVEGARAQLGVSNEPIAAVLLTSGDGIEAEGLGALIAKTGAKLVAPLADHPACLAAAPRAAIVDPWEFAKEMTGLSPIPVRDRGLDRVAYRIDVDGNRVLVTGAFPVLFDHDSTERVSTILAGTRDDALDFLGSVVRLSAASPDVWLPAIPSDGQNANLYDAEWPEIVAGNLRLGHAALTRAASAKTN